MAFVFSSHCYLLLGWLNTCPPVGSGEGILCFVLLVCAAFAFPIKLSLSQATIFLTFTLPVLSPIPLWGRVNGCVGLVASWS